MFDGGYGEDGGDVEDGAGDSGMQGAVGGRCNVAKQNSSPSSAPHVGIGQNLVTRRMKHCRLEEEEGDLMDLFKASLLEDRDRREKEGERREVKMTEDREKREKDRVERDARRKEREKIGRGEEDMRHQALHEEKRRVEEDRTRCMQYINMMMLMISRGSRGPEPSIQKP
eukprot:gb/GEZJ01005031.1/.p1 GENE.gb/GEZJ01005031.1/~~gb/GEZJ01005031.1/.p1  ORF type:complete len:170 (-),score=29.24 gb/GEZJ01005031.1/:66-575(-)